VASWLERAKSEIPKSAALPAAVAAKRNLTAALAAPKAGGFEIVERELSERGIHGIPLADLREAAGPDWPEVERDPALLEVLAAAVATRRMRERGEAPAHYTASTTCAHCGLVPIFAGTPDRVLSCPWCFNRTAGRPVPRP
jgi:hypothetical protein